MAGSERGRGCGCDTIVVTGLMLGVTVCCILPIFFNILQAGPLSDFSSFQTGISNTLDGYIELFNIMRETGLPALPDTPGEAAIVAPALLSDIVG